MPHRAEAGDEEQDAEDDVLGADRDPPAVEEGRRDRAAARAVPRSGGAVAACACPSAARRRRRHRERAHLRGDQGTARANGRSVEFMNVLPVV